MKNNRNQDISFRFGIKPVLDEHKRENACYEIQTVNPPRFCKIAWIIILIKRKQDIPDSPAKCFQTSEKTPGSDKSV